MGWRLHSINGAVLIIKKRRSHVYDFHFHLAHFPFDDLFDFHHFAPFFLCCRWLRKSTSKATRWCKRIAYMRVEPWINPRIEFVFSFLFLSYSAIAVKASFLCSAMEWRAPEGVRRSSMLTFSRFSSQQSCFAWNGTVPSSLVSDFRTITTKIFSSCENEFSLRLFSYAGASQVLKLTVNTSDPRAFNLLLCWNLFYCENRRDFPSTMEKLRKFSLSTVSVPVGCVLQVALCREGGCGWSSWRTLLEFRW